MNEDVLARCRAGEISPQIALAQLLLYGGRPDPAELAARAAAEPAGSPLHALAALAERHRDRLPALAQVVADGLDADGPDVIAATATLFDRLAHEAPEAAVAFYSLGDPALLAEATDELAGVIRAWARVEGADVLDFGCGIGRVAFALAPVAKSVLAMDVSAAMVEQARARDPGTGVRFAVGNGRDLALVDDRSIDVMVAADSFPFLVRAGADVLDHYLAEASRVIRPGGDLLVFNWSYRGDPAGDVAEAQALADRHGFALTRAGERPFTIWDGTGFQLTRQ